MAIVVQKVDQPELAHHESSVLDLVFAMDCTGSMGSYIHQAQQSIRRIVEEIVSSEKSDIELGLVEYRDHPPQDSTFVTRVHDLTRSVTAMTAWLDACSASGGGDGPEAVADALQELLKLSWREAATKICVLISDAPPHGLGAQGDGFPNGCPGGLDPIAITNQLAEKGVTIYAVGCEPSISPYKDFFMTVAHITGGQYVPLRNAKLLAQVIIGGAQEELSLQRLMNEVDVEVQEEAALHGGVIPDEDAVSHRVWSRLHSRGIRTNQLQQNCMPMGSVSKNAREWSKLKSLNQVRSEFVEVRCPTPLTRTSRFGSLEEHDEVSTLQAPIAQQQAMRMVQKAMKKNKLS